MLLLSVRPKARGVFKQHLLRLRHLAVLTFLALASLQCAADDWTGDDKNKHFVVSTVLSSAAYSVCENRTCAFAVAMVPGILKEVYDSQQEGNHFSGKDLAWDALGAFVGVQIGYWTFQANQISFSARF